MQKERKYPIPVSPSGPAGVAGVTYQVAGSRPLDELGDAVALRALPARLRHPSRADLLYGVFISATNDGDRAHLLARRFELVDANLRIFTRLPLAADSAYGYRPGSLPPGGRAPAIRTPVAQNLAEQGNPLVFRLRRAAYRQRLTLRIFDPTGSKPPAEIIVQS